MCSPDVGVDVNDVGDDVVVGWQGTRNTVQHKVEIRKNTTIIGKTKRDVGR